MNLMPTKIELDWRVLLASGKNSAQMMQHFSKNTQSSSWESFKKIQHSMPGAENHHHDDPKSYGICECRHVELKNPPSCLWRGDSEISTAGMVSALKRHRAYGNSHNLGWTVGTMTRILRHRAYKIDRDRRHDHQFSVQLCLRSSFCFRLARSLRAPHERGWDRNVKTSNDSMGWANEEQTQTS